MDILVTFRPKRRLITVPANPGLGFGLPCRATYRFRRGADEVELKVNVESVRLSLECGFASIRRPREGRSPAHAPDGGPARRGQ
jgi:hypothetical protein